MTAFLLFKEGLPQHKGSSTGSVTPPAPPPPRCPPPPLIAPTLYRLPRPQLTNSVSTLLELYANRRLALSLPLFLIQLGNASCAARRYAFSLLLGWCTEQKSRRLFLFCLPFPQSPPGDASGVVSESRGESCGSSSWAVVPGLAPLLPGAGVDALILFPSPRRGPTASVGHSLVPLPMVRGLFFFPLAPCALGSLPPPGASGGDMQPCSFFRHGSVLQALTQVLSLDSSPLPSPGSYAPRLPLFGSFRPHGPARAYAPRAFFLPARETRCQPSLTLSVHVAELIGRSRPQ